MMSLKYLFLFLTFLALASASTAQAATFIQNDELAKTPQVIYNDLFIVGDTVMIDQDVTEDVYAAGNNVNTDGKVGEDVHAAGNLVQISGAVGDDIMAAGNTVELTSATADDVFAAGNNVSVKVQNIKGDAYLAGNNASLAGAVAGSVKVAANVITIKNGTTINGSLTTYGQREPVIEDQVTIKGEVKHVKTDNRNNAFNYAGSTAGAWVLSVAVWAVTALVLFYLLPGLMGEAARLATQRSGRSLAVGFIWLVAFIPAIIIFMIAMVGWPLAMLTGLTSILILLAANAVSSMAVGLWIAQKWLKREAEFSWPHILLGAVAVRLLMFIPILGWLVVMVLMILSSGAMILTLWRRLRPVNSTPSPGTETTVI